MADPNNALIARYAFEETTGANAADSSGASGGNRKGRISRGSFDTLHAPGLGSANNYGAICFTGVGGGPHLSFNMALDSTGTPDQQAGYCYDAMDRSQSVSLWFKPDALPGAGRRYLNLKDASLYDETAGFIIGIDDGSFFARVEMYGPRGNPVEVKANLGPNVLGMWYHVVGEIDRENGQLHLYVNGQKFSSAAGVLPAAWVVVGACPANMGAQTLWGYQGWRPAPAGSFDELRIYTKALTSSEVSALYEEPGLLPPSDPVPANAAVDIDLGPLLSWSPGRPRYQFDVYFGTDAAAVAAAGPGSTGIYQARVGTAQYQVPVILDPTRAYFWRIDAVDGATISTGQVWQFTTGLPSPAKDILSFTWNGSAGLIDRTAHTIGLTVPFGTNVTALSPTLTLSRFATVSPAAGGSRDFSNPEQYTVTAQDGSTQVYTVTVYQAAQPGSILTLPPDLPPGTRYRLVFVTSTTTYSGGANHGANPPWFTAVADYDAFASTRANAVATLASLGATWKALVSTGNPNSSAKTSTATDPVANAATSVPIYQLSGRRVADGYADLWDGTIQNPINVTETDTSPAPQRGGYFMVHTGMTDGGGASGDWSLCYPTGGYAYAGNPTTMPALVNTNGVLTWTWPYDPTAAIIYKFQLSDNLSVWTDVTPPDSRITVLTNTSWICFTLPAGAVGKFCRLVVTPTP